MAKFCGCGHGLEFLQEHCVRETYYIQSIRRPGRKLPSCSVSERSMIYRVMLEMWQLSVELRDTAENRAAIQRCCGTSTGLGSLPSSAFQNKGSDKTDNCNNKHIRYAWA